jgi:hypothetical protein
MLLFSSVFMIYIGSLSLTNMYFVEGILLRNTLFVTNLKPSEIDVAKRILQSKIQNETVKNGTFEVDKSLDDYLLFGLLYFL